MNKSLEDIMFELFYHRTSLPEAKKALLELIKSVGLSEDGIEEILYRQQTEEFLISGLHMNFREAAQAIHSAYAQSLKELFK